MGQYRGTTVSGHARPADVCPGPTRQKERLDRPGLVSNGTTPRLWVPVSIPGSTKNKTVDLNLEPKYASLFLR